MNAFVDQVARDKAERAYAMIVAHEKFCEEREKTREKTSASWRAEVAEKLDGINENIKGLYNRNWAAACSVILLLVAACGYLINHKGI